MNGLLQAEQQGLLKIYRYPNKPLSMPNDGSILQKWRFYKKELGMEFYKDDYDRLLYLRPKLLEEVNNLAKEFKYPCHYTKEDIVGIFKNRIDRQLSDNEGEYYIECAYKSICMVYPELKDQLDLYYDEYMKQKHK